MHLHELFEDERTNKLVVVYGGRFQPFHRGHYHVYLWLCKKYGKENVWIATSDKTNFDPKDGDISPFTYKEKLEIITTIYGIEPRRIVQCKNPTFKPTEVFSQYKGYDCVYLAAVGKKDIERYSESKFFEPVPDDLDVDKMMNVKEKKGYYVAVPMKVDGISGTQIREEIKDAKDDEEKHRKLFKNYFGKYDPVIADLIIAKLKEVK